MCQCVFAEWENMFMHLCMCVYELGCLGIMPMKTKFQKARITSAQASALAFAFQCEVQPPLFMMPYTSKPWSAFVYLTPSISP